MTPDETRELFAGTDGFEWDEAKATSNWLKHNIDFDDATEIFYGRVDLYASERNEERRWVAVGWANGRTIRVVFTRRDNKLRIISAMRARKDEERAYRNKELG